MTDFDDQIKILGELYANHKDDKGFKDFISYNDLGLPLAYLCAEGLAVPSEDGMRYMSETFEMFVASLGIEDTGFTSLEQMLNTIE